MTKDKWVWMPHAGHLIVSRDCRFHLATYVGKCVVSTVGEYLPDETVREIHCQVRHIQLEGRGDYRLADFLRKVGYMEIGADRKYETMVFKAEPASEALEQCCPWRMESGENLDFDGYNDPVEAFKGHLAMCEKWGGQDNAHTSNDDE